MKLIKAPLFEDVNRLAIELVNASSAENTADAKIAYDALKKLCLEHDGHDANHPLQWEALGDFSDSIEDAIYAYENGLYCARELALAEYESSILFALAELHFENGNKDNSKELAMQAASIQHRDMELSAAVDSFLSEHFGN